MRAVLEKNLCAKPSPLWWKKFADILKEKKRRFRRNLKLERDFSDIHFFDIWGLSGLRACDSEPGILKRSPMKGVSTFNKLQGISAHFWEYEWLAKWLEHFEPYKRFNHTRIIYVLLNQECNAKWNKISQAYFCGIVALFSLFIYFCLIEQSNQTSFSLYMCMQHF